MRSSYTNQRHSDHFVVTQTEISKAVSGQGTMVISILCLPTLHTIPPISPLVEPLPGDLPVRGEEWDTVGGRTGFLSPPPERDSTSLEVVDGLA